MSSEEPTTQHAFDEEAIAAGNFALGIDHEKVERETDALTARRVLPKGHIYMMIIMLRF